MSQDSSKPIWVRPKKATQIGGFGLTKCYEMISKGMLISRKVDGLRLISVESIERLGRDEADACQLPAASA